MLLSRVDWFLEAASQSPSGIESVQRNMVERLYWCDLNFFCKCFLFLPPPTPRGTCVSWGSLLWPLPPPSQTTERFFPIKLCTYLSSRRGLRAKFFANHACIYTYTHLHPRLTCRSRWNLDTTLRSCLLDSLTKSFSNWFDTFFVS